MTRSLAGTVVRRVEDPELLEGRGTFVDNLVIDDCLVLGFVRSPHAHAELLGVDAAAALAAPGVVAVLTAGDLAIPAHHSFAPLNPSCARPPLAVNRVRFVGDAVAAVVAETAAQVADAVELVEVSYAPLPSVTDLEEALGEEAPLQFEELSTNVVAGYRDGVDADPLGDAEVVVAARFVNQRVAPVAMEGNGILAIPWAVTDEEVTTRAGLPAVRSVGAAMPLPPGAEAPERRAAVSCTLFVSTQMPHLVGELLERLFVLEHGAIRVVAPHVGGAFGSKAGIAAEHSVTLAAARRLGRPVKWVETRSENLVATPHGRAQLHYVELGLKIDGTITGLSARVLGDAGAYGGFGGGLALGPTRLMAQGPYRIPRLSYEAMAIVTNTTPVGAFRGAGRPEATALLERAMDLAADELGVDPVELRLKNLLTDDVFPFTTSTGARYDSGAYGAALSKAVELAGYQQWRAEQERRRRAGSQRQLGIGVSSYVEVTASGGGELGGVEVHRDGTVTVRVGTSAHGQGHATAFSSIVADALNVAMSSVNFVQSDTAAVPTGGGTGGSRSLQLGGSAILTAAEAVVALGRELAAERLEASVEDLVLDEDGRFGVAGVPVSSLGWGELVEIAEARGMRLAAASTSSQGGPTYPFGAHCSVVEVDTETGRVTVLSHVAVDDCGTILNPQLVEGQQHGGIAQGIAQALYEQVCFDRDGNPVTTTLADYAMPSAAELPSFDAATTETPTPLNPLGAKGIGESGTIGSLPAVQNAVVDALSHLGVRHVDLPCTPQAVFEAIRRAAGVPAQRSTARDGVLPEVVRRAFSSLPERSSSVGPAAAEVDI